eukprot:91454-Prymnesium_polylepis.1
MVVLAIGRYRSRVRVRPLFPAWRVPPGVIHASRMCPHIHTWRMKVCTKTAGGGRSGRHGSGRIAGGAQRTGGSRG